MYSIVQNMTKAQSRPPIVTINCGKMCVIFFFLIIEQPPKTNGIGVRYKLTAG